MLVVAVVTLVTACTACAADGTPTATEGALSGTLAAEVELVDAESEILAIDNVFDPQDAVVEAGTSITFTNAGRNDHNVLPEQTGADWTIQAEQFGPGTSVTHRFTEPGTYRYYCSIHGTIDVGMIGSITVTAPGG
jgi:plastocyanin